ncbi:YraN family protein [Elioraea thermophila]|uniref:YraN family protein n=1 Tax=Elioraea thermophila TaxID=2185104 RepID=UPI000DF12639|nr:YraN family protein [Elioraea thermophila]
METTRRRGAGGERYGRAAEERCAAALAAEGFTVLARRRRTAAGEIDLVARRGPLTVIVEVKGRARAAEAAFALSPRQRGRLLAAAEALMAEEPTWFGEEIRFDLMVVGRDGTVRRIADAFRAET